MASSSATVPEVKPPKWDEDGKTYRDLALTSVSLSNLQDLLDSQANAASCLQLAYLSTSSIAEVQNVIRDAAFDLWSVDADATTTMGLSYSTASSVMKKLPAVFDLLQDVKTLSIAQDSLSEMARSAETIQTRFKSIAQKYTACSARLSDGLNKGNIARAELQKKVEEAQSVTMSSQVSLEEFQKLVVDYNKQLSDMKQEQDDLEKKESDVINKQFALQMTDTVLKGVTGMIAKAGEVFLNASNPEMAIGSNVANHILGGNGDKETSSASGDANGDQTSSSASKPVSPSVSTDATSDSLKTNIADLAKAKAKVEELQNKLSKMGDAKDEEKAKVKEELHKWKETVFNKKITINDAERAAREANSPDGGSNNSTNGWDLAMDIAERAKVVQERRRDAEARRADAQANAIKFQAQLAALAKQSEYDEPHLDQIKTALMNLAKASTSVQALAVFWQSVQTVLDTLASKSINVARPNFIGALEQLPPPSFVIVINSSVGPGLTDLYGNWWAVRDICNAYTVAASKVINTSGGKGMYEWTSAAPDSKEMHGLLDTAIAKGKLGMPVMDSPVMAPVELSLTATAA